MKLYINELQKIIHQNRIEQQEKKIIEILLNAINDWSNDVSSLEEYEMQVASFIKGETTKDKIAFMLSRIDYSTESWQSESLYQLLEIFSYYEDKLSLKEIISKLSIVLKKL